jgi:hypothetical protein
MTELTLLRVQCDVLGYTIIEIAPNPHRLAHQHSWVVAGHGHFELGDTIEEAYRKFLARCE